MERAIAKIDNKGGVKKVMNEEESEHVITSILGGLSTGDSTRVRKAYIHEVRNLTEGH